jgi:hypothetical protein
MKKLNYFLLLTIFTMVILSCDKASDKIPQESSYAGDGTPGIWRLVKSDYNYAGYLNDTTSYNGGFKDEYVTSCANPPKRVASSREITVNDGEPDGDDTTTYGYDQNFNIKYIYGSGNYTKPFVRFNYDASGNFTGYNVLNEDGSEQEAFVTLGPGGLIKTWETPTDRQVYVWKANNLTEVKYYIKEETTIAGLTKSFNASGKAERHNKATLKFITAYLSKVKTRLHDRSSTDGWIYVASEFYTYDKNYYYHLQTLKPGWPGSTTLRSSTSPLNWISTYRGYSINEDGSLGELYHQEDYTVLAAMEKYVTKAGIDYWEKSYNNEAHVPMIYKDYGVITYSFDAGCTPLEHSLIK